MSTSALPRPIDPFAGSVAGRYQDDAVVVLRRATLEPLAGERWTTVTEHFAVGSERGRLVVLHALHRGRVDNDVAAMLTHELFAPGWAGGADTFERLLTGVVLSCQDDALASWEAFYRNTLDRLDTILASTPDPTQSRPPGPQAPEGTLAGFAPVYRRAEQLVRGAATHSLLDLGSCFGFFPLRVATGRAGERISVRAADISPGSCALLGRISMRLAAPVPVLVCDAAAVPLPDAGVDTVTLLHVLEHVDSTHGEAMVREAIRLARRRVIVAVPLESEPDPAFGHLRTLGLSQLATIGADAAAGLPWRSSVEEHHGGWLVLDR
jgi:SAM-dependent methyltransferase